VFHCFNYVCTDDTVVKLAYTVLFDSSSCISKVDATDATLHVSYYTACVCTFINRCLKLNSSIKALAVIQMYVHQLTIRASLRLGLCLISYVQEIVGVLVNKSAT
jgi:hypothetical protein